MTIYLDLDGTLIDVWARYHAIFRDFLTSKGLKVPELHEYREVKRKIGADSAVLRHFVPNGEALAPAFMPFKHARLEAPEYLAYDTPIGDISRFRAAAEKGATLSIITMRHHEDRLRAQLAALGLDAKVDNTYCVKPQKGHNPKIERLVGLATPADAILGDSPTDVMCGQYFGMQTFFVETGLFSWERVQREAGDTAFSKLASYMDYQRP